MTLREAGVTLIDCDHRTPPPAEGGYPYVTIPQLKGGRIDLTDVRRITREHFLEWTRKAKPTANDVILSRRCNPGETAVSPPNIEFALGQNLVLLRADGTKVHPPLLRWLVRGPEWWIQIGKFINVGAVFDSLRCADVPKFELRIPPLSEQHAIAHILGTLDDKIELNRRMNETLEEIERSLFIARSREEDWIEHPLEDICAIYDGPHATPKLVDHGPIFLGISNLANGSLDLSDLAHVTDFDFAKWTRRVTPCSGDVVFSYETRLGQAGLIPAGIKCCLGRRMGLLRAKMGASVGVVLLRAYLAPEFQEVIRERTIHGSTVDRIPLVEIGRFPIRLPEGEMLDRLAGQLLPLRRRIEENQGMSRTLAALRDTLLPKLISGELRVKTAEKMVEAVA